MSICTISSVGSNPDKFLQKAFGRYEGTIEYYGIPKKVEVCFIQRKNKWVAFERVGNELYFLLDLDTLPADAKLIMTNGPPPVASPDEIRELEIYIIKCLHLLTKYHTDKKGVELSPEKFQLVIDKFFEHLKDDPASKFWTELSQELTAKDYPTELVWDKHIMLQVDMHSGVYEWALHKNLQMLKQAAKPKEEICRYNILWHKNVRILTAAIKKMFD